MNKKRKQIEFEMEVLLKTIINYPYENEFRRIDINNLIKDLEEYKKIRKDKK